MAGNQHELFSRLRFDGDRFKEHLIPLAALGEFQAYDGAIRAACRFLFLSRNPNRKRFGFDLELVLGVIEEGSALSAVNRRIAQGLRRDRQAELYPPPSGDPHADLFRDARDMVTELVAKVADSKTLRDAVADFGAQGAAARTLVTELSKLGASLDDGEQLGLRGPTSNADEAVLERDFGAAIIDRFKLKTELDRQETLSGFIRASDRDNNTFRLETLDGLRVPLEAPPLFFKNLAASMLKDGEEVQIAGVATYRNEKLSKMVALSVRDAFETRLVLKENPTTSVRAQLEQLATLEQGWDDDDAPAPSEVTMKTAAAALTELGSRFGIPDPFIYPTYEGAVRAEWPALRWNLALEVLDTKLKLFAIDRAKRDPDSITHFMEEQVAELARFLSDRMRETS